VSTATSSILSPYGGGDIRDGDVCFRLDASTTGCHVQAGEVEQRYGKSLIACCEGCTVEAPIKRCARCHVAGYCGFACQKQHWKVHKQSCVERQRAAEKRWGKSRV